MAAIERAAMAIFLLSDSMMHKEGVGLVAISFEVKGISPRIIV